ncbi:hypothetical protein CDL12_27796 [Handroanthus impetiginosus]|uniref:Uncharacterized protein n=1 Tax=Handroanthus impetiginosus TaxID=429701 RepID=A0A2G9G311_9LAMI|nr:hypothetical protein CDL12_27796 [Handroanthus impetiginosus]
MTYAKNQQKRHDMHLTSTKNLSMGKSRNDVNIERSPSPPSFNNSKNLIWKKSRNESEKDIDENNPEAQGKDSSDSEVEILASATINEKGVVGPSVPSKKFHKKKLIRY